MINSIYAYWSFGVLVLCGVLILTRGRHHRSLWLALAVYWSALGFIQVQTEQNSIPYWSIPLSFIVGYTAVYTAKTSRTFWPLIIATLMGLKVLCDVIYAAYELNADNPTFRYRRLHQDIGGGLFYACLLCLSVHPKIRTLHDKSVKWVYAGPSIFRLGRP